jgi:hypothetical protein
MRPILFQTSSIDQAVGVLFSSAFSICALIFAILIIIGWWKLFTKAGQPGWLAIIPIVNGIIYIQISGKPVWWILLLLIPIVNIIVLFLIHQSLAERFGQGILFALGLMFLTPFFVLILAFGDYRYRAV